MSVRSLNKVMLIGNLTRDPELRFTPSGAAVCTFGLATNRAWTTQTGETREETEFHRIVAWNKLAELCGQLLTKGRKVFVEGRLTTRTWTGQDGRERTTVEIVIEDMIILDSRKMTREGEDTVPPPVEQQAANTPGETVDSTLAGDAKDVKKKTGKPAPKEESSEEQISPDDIPF